MKLKPETCRLPKQSQQATVDNSAVQLNCIKTDTEFNGNLQTVLKRKEPTNTAFNLDNSN